MGIVKDQRPTDWAYKAVFKEKDLPSLEEMARHIRETHDTDMIENFNAKCEQKLRTGAAEMEGMEIQQVTKTEDLVVNGGLQQCINIILGTSATRWSHLAFTPSAGGPAPSVTDTSLTSSPPTAVSIATYGWMEPKGMKLFFGVVYPQDTSSPFGNTSISEIGICNGLSAPPASTLFNRELFSNNPPTRTVAPDLTVYTSVFLFSCVIEFCPVA